ncbi:MarR family winged helix-turn-helix transcriptional regulator [Actinoalloteichus caeruleus]|uniref:DNA-binding transcriptional regulator, MarR family n=1 Tax=Actinoalloteichus caeruleus DSM 43889 TaxID=1120930 RepID=A0ABT1JFI3_ACTCY|nr:MarR family winged helix-turn-helix transcriptional regulator [Actinoalloteichus caeruleus]MCP2331254.1 DNA-binding transcriptional regulator, MarR family [Actinoalloteichus caeruleus DSM 43889]
MSLTPPDSWIAIRRTVRDCDATPLPGALRLTDLLVLLELDRQPQQAGSVAETLGISPSGLTRIAHRLEDRRLLHRVRCFHDRRGVLLMATPDGVARTRMAYPHAQTVIRAGTTRLRELASRP